MIFSAVRTIIIFSFICIFSCSTVRSPNAQTIYSAVVKDSFELYVDLPVNYTKGNIYSVVFYMDANLKSGKELRRQIKLDSNKAKLSHVIFVGIGHIGDYHVKRRRDLIPFVVNKSDTLLSDDKNYGQAEHFYRFISEELIPLINQRYPNNGRYSYIGHSFGGLFGFYCLMKPEPLFKNIIALSPSLWVNNNNSFQHEDLFAAAGYQMKDVTLYHACGTAEWANKVLYSSRDMRDVLNKRKYPGLHYIYKEHPGKNHNGVVPVSLEYVLSNIEL